MASRFVHLFNRLPLQAVLTIPFVIQVFAVVGVVGYLSFRNGQATVNDLASQLRSELSARILQQLQATVEQPYVINKINANSLLQGDLNVTTGQGEHQFWQQAKVFASTNAIYCATEADGALLSVGRSKGGVGNALQIQIANEATNRFMYYYEVDTTGRRAFLRSKGTKTYDPRIRPWYKAAEAKGESTWSEVYLDFDSLLPTITANTPVYDSDNGQLLGICATDIILSKELNAFLRSLDISQSGIAFILEPSGVLIASSTEEPITSGSGEDTTLLPAAESENPLIRGVHGYLEASYDGLHQVESSQRNFLLEGDRQYLEVVRFNDEYGLDWIVVLVVPEADFMAQVHENTKITLLLSIIALLVTILIGLLLTQWLTRPLRQLSSTARDIAQGDWDKAIELERLDAIGDLSRSFAAMVSQLKMSFTNLEERIEERTVELVQLNQELQRIAHVDGLTQASNRRHFDYVLAQEWRRLAREQQPLSLLLCDVDYFKRYNDTYGHQAGDRCLQHIAQILIQAVQRPADLVARYGGEEFAIILVNTQIQGAIHLAEKIQMNLEATNLPHGATGQGRITLSLGIATMIPQPKTNAQSLISAADLALYAAKAKGRNGYCIAPNSAAGKPQQE